MEQAGWSSHGNGRIPDAVISGIPEPIIHHYGSAPKYMAKITENGLVIDIKLAVVVLLCTLIGGAGFALLGMQVLPFYTRVEAKADKDYTNYQIAQMGLRVQQDEQRYDGHFQQDDQNWQTLEQSLSAINAQLAALQAVQGVNNKPRR